MSQDITHRQIKCYLSVYKNFDLQSEPIKMICVVIKWVKLRKLKRELDFMHHSSCRFYLSEVLTFSRCSSPVVHQTWPQHGSACVGLYNNFRQEKIWCKCELYKQQKIRKLLLQNWVWNPLIQKCKHTHKVFSHIKENSKFKRLKYLKWPFPSSFLNSI